MVKRKDISDFCQKLIKSSNEYSDLIEEKEKGEMTFADKNTIAIWEARINAIEKMIHELEMLEFELFV